MPAANLLKSFRQDGYGQNEPEEKEESSGGPRMIKLTDEEAKELQGYQKQPGMEQQCLVSGRLGENGEFTVTSVHSPEGGQKNPDEAGMAQEMMGKMGMPQTMPSPS